MLDFMRKHAENWGIKVLLGALSISFALFFGYSAIQDTGLGPQAAAIIDDKVVPAEQFRLAYDSALKRLQEDMAGELPEDLARYLRVNTLQQLIARKIRVAFAEELGFQIPDEEVARTIRQQEQFYVDGVFDFDSYQRQFRPFYKQRYGQDYEEALREDLMLDHLNSFFRTAMLSSDKEISWLTSLERKRWNFEIISIPQEVADEETLQRLLEQWRTGPITEAELKKVRASVSEKKDVSLRQRRRILPEPLADEIAQSIMQLKPSDPVFAEAILQSENWHLVKLKHVEESGDVDEEALIERGATRYSEFITQWIDDFRQKLHIEQNVDL